MITFFIDPSYVEPHLFKYILKVLKVKYAFSFIPQKELNNDIYSTIHPMLQGIYDEGNAKQLVDSCAYRILKQIGENVKIEDADKSNRTVPRDQEYRPWSIWRVLEISSCINVLILLKSYPNYHREGYRTAPVVEHVDEMSNIHDKIVSKCFSALKCYHDNYIKQIVFIISDYLLTDFFVCSKRWIDTTPQLPPGDYPDYVLRDYEDMLSRPHGFMDWDWLRAHLKNKKGGVFYYGHYISNLLNTQFPDIYPLIEEDGKKIFTGYLTDEGKYKRKEFYNKMREAREDYESSLPIPIMGDFD